MVGGGLPAGGGFVALSLLGCRPFLAIWAEAVRRLYRLSGWTRFAFVFTGLNHFELCSEVSGTSTKEKFQQRKVAGFVSVGKQFEFSRVMDMNFVIGSQC